MTDNNRAEVLFGLGDGSFAPAVPLAAGPGAGKLAVADFNADGKRDLFLGNTGQPIATVNLYTGSHTFAAHAVSVDREAYAVMAADLNSDGRRDVLAILATAGADLLAGDGKGGFGKPALLPIAVNARDGVLADFDRDGHLDLAAIDASGVAVDLFSGDGKGHFQAGSSTTVPQSTHLAAGDFNGDGAPDLVVVSSFDKGAVTVLVNAGDGSFLDPPLGLPVDAPVGAAAVHDLDGDGRADIVVSVYDDQAIVVFRNTTT